MADPSRGAGTSSTTIPEDAIAWGASDPRDAFVVGALFSVIAIGIPLASEGDASPSLRSVGETMLVFPTLPAILAGLI